MGLDKIVYNTKYTPVVNIKLSAISAAMGRAKMYELLHKQVWRKTRLMWPNDGPNYNHSRVPVYTMPGLTTFNGRPVAFIKHWDIKSPSIQPYAYEAEGLEMRFGLNQLFVEQDPFKPYEGNPKSGIYHDDCYITPKMLPVTAEHEYYVYRYTAPGDENITQELVFRERNDDGVVVVSSIVLENYVSTVAGRSTNRYRLLVNYINGTVDRIDLREGSYSAFYDVISKLPSHRIWGHAVEEYKIDYGIPQHGAVVWEQTIDMPFQLTSVNGTLVTTQELGWIRQYSDGTVVQYRPLEVEYWGDGMDNTIPGHYKILPMVYTDTGDLTMPVADFVKNWTDYFELVVHEDSEWWESFLAPIIAIVSVVVAVFAWPLVMGMGPILGPIMGGALVAGTAMSVMGTLGGDAKLAKLGGLIAGAAALAGSLSQAFTREIGARTLFQQQVADMFGETFANFVSAGMENLAKIGSNIISVTTKALELGSGIEDSVESAEEIIDASRIEFTTTLGKSNDEYDVFGQMGKQFEMY